MTRRTTFASAATVMAAALAACTGNPAGIEEDPTASDEVGSEIDYEEVTLTLADVYPEPHYLTQEGSVYFQELVERESGGAVTIDIYHARQLGGPEEMINLLSSGTADIAFTSPGYLPSQMPLTGSFSLPGSFENGTIGTRAYAATVEDENSVVRQDDYEANGLVPLFVGVTGDYEIMASSRPIDSIQSLDGLSVRSAGGTIDLIIDAIGSSPVPISSGEIYQALERGTVDANLQGVSGAVGNSIQEVSSYLTTNGDFTAFVSAWTMGTDRFAELPAETQELLLDAGRRTSEHIAEVDAEVVEESLAAFDAEGVEQYEFTEDELAQLAEMFAGVEGEWAAQLPDPTRGETAIEEMRAAVEEASGE